MKNIKLGVFGVGRGMAIAKNFMLNGAEVVAICDFHKERLEAAKTQLDGSVKAFDNFDDMLDAGVDAIILANFFHEHAPYAIKCLERGIHVFSECISNGTMGEGVALLRAAEKSNAIYMLAENYPHMLFNREMKRICDGGTLGQIYYAEGEYNHPANPNDTNFRKEYIYFPEHWRNYLPKTYYLTHSLAPIMAATGATPTRVIGLTVKTEPNRAPYPTAHRTLADKTAIMMTQNDDGSVFKFTGCASFGAHANSYRICGANGQIENLRGMGEEVMLRYNDWAIPNGAKEVNRYTPDWNDKDEELIKTSGHGGGDFVCARMFLDCIKEGKQPPMPFDVKSAIIMSSVAILGFRSVLAGGAPFDIPNYDCEVDRKKYENDFATPFYSSDGKCPNYPCCSDPAYEPTEEQFALYKKDLGIE